jgi:Protein of unknown function (DUF3105)
LSKSSNRSRKDRVEQIRREAKAAERRRTLLVVLACGVVAALIVGAAAVSYLTRHHNATKYSGTSLADIGASTAASGCSDIQTHDANGNQQHEAEGTSISYDQAPPEYGPHWPTPATWTRHFYTADERPPLEQLVHNLEHGYTIVWYDDDIAGDDGAMSRLQGIAAHFDGTNPDDPSTYKLIVAPYTSADPGSFPAGKDIALTHWSADWSTGQPQDQQGISEYCSTVSGPVVQQFVADYPFTASPEPNTQ